MVNPKTSTPTLKKGRAIAIGARSIAYGDHSNAIGTLAIAMGNYFFRLWDGNHRPLKRAVSPWGTMRTFIANIPSGWEITSKQYKKVRWSSGSIPTLVVAVLALGEYTFANRLMHDEHGKDHTGKSKGKQ